MDFFSRLETFSLDNGVRIVVLPRAGFSVEIHALIATGSMHEGNRLGCGVSHYLEHMLFQGCAGFPGHSAPESLQKYGFDINAYTTFDRTVVTTRAGNEKLPEALRAIAAMVCAPGIADAAFQKEREVILRECNRHADSPEARLFDAARELAFPRHPVRMPILGYPEKVAALTREDLLAYHAERYAPCRCVLAAVGNVDPEKFIECAEKEFGSWRRSGFPETVFPSVLRSGGARETLLFPDPIERMMMMMPAPGIADAETPAFDLLLGMLGSGGSSLLTEKLERKLSLAHGFQFYYYAIDDFGVGIAEAETTPEKFDAMRAALEAEMKKLSRSGLTAAALRKEKQRRHGDDLAAWNDFGTLARILGTSLLQTGKADFEDEYRRRLNAVSIDEVRECAAKKLSPELFCCVAQRNRTTRKRAFRPPEAVRSMHIGKNARICTATIDRRETPADNAVLLLPGAVFETGEWRGAGELCARLLSCGGGGISENDFLARLDALGAAMDVSFRRNTMAIEVNAPHRRFADALELIGRVLAAPGFDDEQFERERERLAQKIETRLSTPFGAAFGRCRKLLFGDHPYSGEIPPESLRALTPETIRKFYRSLFCRRQAVAGFTGERPETEKYSALFLGGAPWHDRALRPVPSAVFPAKDLFDRIEMPREQLAVIRGIPGIASSSDPTIERLFLLLRNNENGLFSQLFQSVREKESLVYSTGMLPFGGFVRGAFAFYGLTRPGCGEKLEALLRGEIARLASGGVTKDEFEQTREKTIFSTGSDAENPLEQLESAMLELYYGHTPLPTRGEFAALRAIKRNDFNRFLRDVLRNAPGVSVFAGAVEK
ncbi:MAG: insulinase family protein [Victivallaceae bacterium]|nr:insulinase family protein [Victivallaceae bacterium]